MIAFHDRLQKLLLSNEVYLTKQQQEVITFDGLGVVRACPGSGKTRALAARVAYRISNWESKHSGIAALSFTNVAIEELRSGLRELGVGIPGANPHFIGTIDSFIYQNITGPHLSVLIPDIKARPELMVQEAWVSDVPAFCIRFLVDGKERKFPYNVSVTKYFIKSNGQVGWHPDSNDKKFALPLPKIDDLIAAKHALARSGYISISDSMYYAYQILKLYPQLAVGLALRYPEIVIDECQDTSDIQHDIISILVATGMTQVLMIGDPYQSIYEFNDANPQLMLNRIEKDGWYGICLTENFRSSEKICNCVNSFFSFEPVMTANGYYSSCHVDPILFRYHDDKVGDLPEIFEKMTTSLSNKCGFDNSKTVARSHRAVHELRRLTGDIEFKPNYCTSHLINAARDRDNLLLEEAFREVQTCLCRIIFDRASLGYNREPLKDMPYRQWRLLVWSIVSSLPDSNIPLNDWIPAARDVVNRALVEINIKPIHKLSAKIRCPKECPDITLSCMVGNKQVDTLDHKIETVHKVKGQTLDGLMLVASPRTKNRPSSVHKWLVIGGTDDTNEEQRIAYVAMTRPRKFLVVAIPESAWNDCAPKFVGFHQIDNADISFLKDICDDCDRIL